MKVQEEIKPTGLDVKIAERVMRLTPCDKWKSVNFGRAGGAAMVNYGCEHNSNCYSAKDGPPRYSTIREVAMQLVDHFAEADWRIMLTSNPHAPKTLRWRVELFKELWPHSNNISVMELAETLPEAICLAALSAKAAEVNTR